MPEPTSGIGAAGSAMAGLSSTFINAALQDRNNREQREYNDQMYKRQRADSLSDWNMQNEYNSPSAQMARLKAAGLNPNLVYGNGATAMSNQQVKSTDSKSYNPTAPQLDFSGLQNSFMQYYDTQLKEAQVNQLAVQNELVKQQTIHETLKALNTVANTKNTEASTETQNTLRQSSLDALVASIKKMQADTISTTNQETRNQDLHAGNKKLQDSNINKIAQDIITQKVQNAKTKEETTEVKARVNNLLRDGMLKDLEIDVRTRGGNPNDPYWQKKIQEVLEYVIEGGKNWKSYFEMLMRENPNR